MHRITKSDLNNMVARLNHTAGTPTEPYTKGEDGNYHPNALCYHLDGAYGGWQLAQMCTEGSGTSHPIHMGYVSKKDCYYAIHTFIMGMEAGKE